MSETVLSIAGFLMILVILFLLNRKWTSPFVAISTVPVITCILIGHGASLSAYIVKGIGSIATTGIMFIFSVTFFGIMSDTGAFDPFVRAIIKATKGDPVKLMVGVCAFAFIGHLDGSGVTTVLLVVPPMLPIFDRLHMRRTSLGISLGLIAGIMNAVPWGGPTLRAATVLKMDVMELWRPFIPTQAFGLLLSVAICYLVGRREKKRLVAEGVLHEGSSFNYEEFIPTLTPAQEKVRRPKLLVANWFLIIAVLGLMVSSILAPITSFMLGVAAALLLNYRDPELQRKMIDDHGKDAILLATVIFSAGVLMGVMGQSGMSSAMAHTLVNLIPMSFAKWMAPIIGVFTVPLSVLFDADSYYYGIMPIIIETAEALGAHGIDIARASIIGQITTGWPMSPMIGTFYLFTGMIGLDISDWMKNCIKYFILVTVAMTLFACVTGLFTF